MSESKSAMKTRVEIQWDEPKIKEWLCPDNISIALHAYCRNTKFTVRKVLTRDPQSEELARLREQNEKMRDALLRIGVRMHETNLNKEDLERVSELCKSVLAELKSGDGGL